MQVHNRVAAIGGTTGVCVSRACSAGVIGHAVEPSQAITGSLFVNSSNSVVHRQMQVHNGVTAVGSATGICVCRACRAGVIGHTVKPGHAIAGHLLVNTHSGVVHRQMQVYDRVATIGGSIGICICWTCRAGIIGHTVEPGHAIAGHLFINAHSGIFHRQMQTHDGVATIGGTTIICVGRSACASIVSHTVKPGHAVAGGLFVNTCNSVVHRQMQSND